jgi:hypothetical protein
MVLLIFFTLELILEIYYSALVQNLHYAIYFWGFHQNLVAVLKEHETAGYGRQG